MSVFTLDKDHPLTRAGLRFVHVVQRGRSARARLERIRSFAGGSSGRRSPGDELESCKSVGCAIWKGRTFSKQCSTAPTSLGPVSMEPSS